MAAVLAGAALLGCSPGPSGPVDPLCGDVSAALDDPALRLERVPSDAPLFRPTRDRRHRVAGRPRDAVTGFRRVPLVAREITLAPGTARHVERVPVDPRVAFETERLIAPRVRAAGADEWATLGWRRLEPVAGEDGAVYEVPFELAGLAEPGATVEIGVTAYVSSERAAHAWETEVLTPGEGAILAASLGALPAGAAEGSVAWRALACEGEQCTCLHAEVMDAGEAAAAGWRERRLSLEAFADRPVQLRLETEALAGGADATDPGLWAAPALYVRARDDAPRRPNLLMISLDTLGADHLGLYGYPRDTSPFLDDVLAPRGTVFLDAIAPATTTGPSHMTLFTSLPPSVHGAVSNLGGQSLPAAVPTLAETLREAGYATAAVTENGAITRALGFDRGFDHYEENRSARMVRPEGHIEATFAAGGALAERLRGLPWFVFVQTYQVHHPYSPPPAYASLFVGDGLDPSGTAEAFSGGRSEHAPILYDQEIRYTDDVLGRWLGTLEAAGLLEDTIVVVLADHGEAFFEHAYLGHGADVHRETVRVPLIFVGPGVPAGRRVATRVGLADVMPTVLELLDVPVPPGTTGRSLVPAMRGDGGATDGVPRPIFSEAWQLTGVTRQGGVKLDQPTLAVVRGDYKLIRTRGPDGPVDALYDLAADPHERRDLLASGRGPEGEAARERRALAALLDDYAAENARRAAALGVRPDASPETEIDPERLEKLRALGYVE